MQPQNDRWQALRLRRMPQAQMQARNALVQRVQDCPVHWAGQPWLLSIELCAPAEVMGRDELWHARCHWGGGDFELWVSAEGARAWLQALYPQLALPRLPAGFAQAVVQAALEALREAVEGLGRGAAHLEFLRPCNPQGPAPPGPADFSEGSQVMDLTLRSPPASGPRACPPVMLRARVATDALGLVLMAALVAGHPPARHALDTDTVRLCLQAQIGVTWLTRRQVRDLAAGDLVLMEQVFVTPERELWLAHAGWGLRVHWSDDGMTVLSEWAQGGFTMPEDLYAPSGEPAPYDLDELPLRLTFDLGEREITLGELRELQVGQGIDLGVPLGGPVQLRVQGVLVARGDLIEVDGRLGVAIASLHGALPPAVLSEGHEEHVDPQGREDREDNQARAPLGRLLDPEQGDEQDMPGVDRDIEPGAGRDVDTSRAAELPTDA